jgi:hypothetical protein
MTMFEDTVAGLPELSVTLSPKFQAPAVVRRPVETDGSEEEVQLKGVPRLLKALAPGASWNH